MKNEFIALRVSEDTIKKLDGLSSAQGKTRTEFVREVLENIDLCYKSIEADKARKQQELAQLCNLMVQKMMETVMADLFDKVTPQIMHTFGQAAHQVADKMVAEQKKRCDIGNK